MLVTATFIVNSAFNFAMGLLLAAFLGPSGYGKFAIALQIAVVLNTLFLDWVRHAAIRYYSADSRSRDPAVRATLDVAFGLSSLGVAVVAGIAILLGRDFELPLLLASLVPVVGICNGLFDYHTSLLRARFEDRAYARLLIVRNALALLLTAGGAWWLESPAVAFAGVAVSVVIALLAVRSALADADLSWRHAEPGRAKLFLVYALPIIAANTIYQALPLWNRANITEAMGFAANGQFSLAYDLGSRLFATVGSALELLLLPLALRTQSELGMAEARRRVAENMGIVLALVSPLAVGIWLVLPSFEAVLVPSAYRGIFSELITILLPGFTALALVQYGAAAAFQLQQRTWPLVVASLAAVVVYGLMVRGTTGVGGVDIFVRAQLAGMLAALVVAAALVLLVAPVAPRPRDLAGTLLGCGAMVAAVWPLRELTPGWPVLLASALAGALAYAAVVAAFDVGQLRSSLLARLRARRAAP
jgi:O-antigen/teichoic acid export membrane protein